MFFVRPTQVSGVAMPQQAPTLPMQAGTVPATLTTQFDWSSMIEMIMMIMMMAIMMKVMTKATEGV